MSSRLAIYWLVSFLYQSTSAVFKIHRWRRHKRRRNCSYLVSRTCSLTDDKTKFQNQQTTSQTDKWSRKSFETQKCKLIRISSWNFNANWDCVWKCIQTWELQEIFDVHLTGHIIRNFKYFLVPHKGRHPFSKTIQILKTLLSSVDLDPADTHFLS